MASSGSYHASYEKMSVARGHHVYKVNWTPEVREVLQVRTEDGNEHDEHAVAVIKDGPCCTTFNVPSLLVFPVAWK